MWMAGVDLAVRVCNPNRVFDPKAPPPDAVDLAALKFLRRCLEALLRVQKPLPDQAIGFLFDPSSPIVCLR